MSAYLFIFFPVFYLNATTSAGRPRALIRINGVSTKTNTLAEKRALPLLVSPWCRCVCFKETRVAGRVRKRNKIANTHVAQPYRGDIGQKRQLSWRRAPYTLSCTARSRRPTHMTVATNHKLVYLHRDRASPTQKKRTAQGEGSGERNKVR